MFQPFILLTNLPRAHDIFEGAWVNFQSCFQHAKPQLEYNLYIFNMTANVHIQK